MPNFDLTVKRGEEPQRLVLDGKILEDSSGERSIGELIRAELWGEAIRQTESLSILDLSKQFSYIDVRLPNISKDPQGWEFPIATFDPGEAKFSEPIIIMFVAWFDLGRWARPYGLLDVWETLRSVLDADPQLGFQYWSHDDEGHETDESPLNRFGVTADVPSSTTMGEIIKLSSRLYGLVRLIKQELSSRGYQHSVITSFEFPAPIRSACGQYLLYFVQFLRDLGIEADSELKEEASKVLFTVTPRDQKQALNIIRDALALYLQIPSSPDFNVMVNGFYDVAVSQLQANVLHLQSQLALAGAVLQAKEATIAARDAQISALQQRLDLGQFATVASSDIKTASDSEPIIEGVLAVKKNRVQGSGI